MEPPAEKFVHRHTTRTVSLLVLALILGPIGCLLLFAALVFLVSEGWEPGPGLLLPMVGGMFTLFGVYYTFRFFRPLETVSDVTEEGIVCRMNGVTIYDIKRDDVAEIEVSVGPIDYIHVDLKDGRRIDIRPRYFWDFDELREHLRACDYRLAE